tara:strand:+ start:215 stop:658 length:444 start_codon:yes stop_codon:yes gene_type:complete
VAKSKTWFKKYGIHTTPKPSKGFKFLGSCPVGALFTVPSINLEGVLLSPSLGSCQVVLKNRPKFTKMGEFVGNEDKKTTIASETQVVVNGQTNNSYLKRKRKARSDRKDSVSARKDDRLLRMARKEKTKRRKKRRDVSKLRKTLSGK